VFNPLACYRRFHFARLFRVEYHAGRRDNLDAWTLFVSLIRYLTR